MPKFIGGPLNGQIIGLPPYATPETKFSIGPNQDQSQPSQIVLTSSSTVIAVVQDDTDLEDVAIYAMHRDHPRIDEAHYEGFTTRDHAEEIFADLVWLFAPAPDLSSRLSAASHHPKEHTAFRLSFSKLQHRINHVPSALGHSGLEPRALPRLRGVFFVRRVSGLKRISVLGE